eukprot:CAMPEP_0195508188 /NCGR_PEP_ID=MMETSP0794_2-20130614/1470_1 /TAXON_ID=515487 /ORGANISM="Stephanopyxis turris, Strain CCMP 815" /LENGTH=339 /DNA_ID=CAMNT_0040635093 /DNA_START=237 /DNA_END=1256 /DNA_ORIENTATION=-
MANEFAGMFGNVASEAFQHVSQQGESPPQSATAVPPASAKAVRQLPTVTVSKEDLLDENNRECCICFEDNTLGSKVTRLPCGHLFHRPCISEWLHKHCTCPICRFELETDNPTYERGRLERMRHRKPRYHKYELERMSIRELHDLMSRLNLSSHGIMEKKDLVNHVLSSGKVDLISRKGLEDVQLEKYTLTQLRGMGIANLKNAMAGCGVFFDPVEVIEKEDMVQIFKNSGRILLLPEQQQQQEVEPIIIDDELHDGDHQDQTIPDNIPGDSPQPTTNTDHIIMDNTETRAERLHRTTSNLSTYSISRLKALARDLNVSISDCLEKKEMVDRLALAVDT